MTGVERSLAASFLIDSMFRTYKAGELNNAGELVRKRIAKYLRKRSVSNRETFSKVMKLTDDVWEDAKKYFDDKNITIEVKTVIMELFNYFEDELSKYANVREKHIEKFMIQATDNKDAEMNSYDVVEYLVQNLGLEKRVNPFHTKFATLKENWILERK